LYLTAKDMGVGNWIPSSQDPETARLLGPSVRLVRGAGIVAIDPTRFYQGLKHWIRLLTCHLNVGLMAEKIATELISSLVTKGVEKIISRSKRLSSEDITVLLLYQLNGQVGGIAKSIENLRIDMRSALEKAIASSQDLSEIKVRLSHLEAGLRG